MLETLLLKDDKVERCGLVLKDGSTVEIANLAENPEEGFEMSAEEALPYIEAENVSGTWHTHPKSDPTLSGEDYKGFLAWPELEHSIIGRRKGKVVVTRYRIEDGIVVVCA